MSYIASTVFIRLNAASNKRHDAAFISIIDSKSKGSNNQVLGTRPLFSLIVTMF